MRYSADLTERSERSDLPVWLAGWVGKRAACFLQSDRACVLHPTITVSSFVYVESRVARVTI